MCAQASDEQVGLCQPDMFKQLGKKQFLIEEKLMDAGGGARGHAGTAYAIAVYSG
jgi:hypothetical protein